jgi:ice-binding like protein
MNHRQKQLSACLLAMAALLSTAPVQAATAPSLGTASNFSVLGGAGVTCTDSTITGVAGSLLTVTQTATCNIVGSINQGDATAIQAFNDAALAYGELAAIPCPADAEHNLVGDLGGKVLSPGLYCISGVGLLTSPLTLNGPSDGIWIFKASTSITPIGGSVVMAGGGQAGNVYWHTGTAVSLDNTRFVGNVLAGSAVTFTGVGSSLVGRALAKTAVTMTGTNISVGSNGGVQPPVVVPPPVQGATAPSLGAASNIAVLGGTGVTCTASGVAGNVGSLVSVTGFPGLCTLIGTVNAADATSTTAFNDVALAYDALKAMPCNAANNLTGQPLGGKTLAPGVYCFPSTTADLTTGTLTLDGGGNSNAVWVFQVGTAITTGTASVVMINGGQQSNVFWQLGTAATIGTDTAFKGNILAGSAISFTGVNSSLVGRALAKTAVTMTGANISLGQ